MAAQGRFTLSEKKEIPTGVVNLIVAIYQLALSKTLGTGSAALTQLTLRKATGLIDDMLKDIGFELGEVEDIANVIPRVFKQLGISEKVEVEVPKEAEASGNTYVIKVYDSIFKPVAILLGRKGVKFTLSPESFIAAYVIQKALQKRNPNARVRISLVPRTDAEKPLEFHSNDKVALRVCGVRLVEQWRRRGPAKGNRELPIPAQRHREIRGCC
ncbi:MAG: hypothetical protein DRO39_09680 [Thermoprotei archaeon]|nr:MAG: hypothetical protein DRO39_09680 [Thermoprotei archaeon]